MPIANIADNKTNAYIYIVCLRRNIKCHNITNSFGCINCTNCNNCHGCIDCYNCIKCTNCIKSVKCINCDDCIFCNNSKNCAKCKYINDKTGGIDETIFELMKDYFIVRFDILAC